MRKSERTKLPEGNWEMAWRRNKQIGSMSHGQVAGVNEHFLGAGWIYILPGNMFVITGIDVHSLVALRTWVCMVTCIETFRVYARCRHFVARY